MQMTKDAIIVAHIDRQAKKKAANFAMGKRDAMQSISYRAKGYAWQQEAYNRGYRHGLYLLAVLQGTNANAGTYVV